MDPDFDAANSDRMDEILEYTEYAWRYRVHNSQITWWTGILGHRAALCEIEGAQPIAVLTEDGRLVVYRGYAWNGANRPAINTVSSRRGSLVHDVIYQMMAKRLLPRSCKRRADQLLGEICRMDGMLPFRAGAWAAATDRWGNPKPSKEPVVRRAP